MLKSTNFLNKQKQAQLVAPATTFHELVDINKNSQNLSRCEYLTHGATTLIKSYFE
jgi:hypothetical protein